MNIGIDIDDTISDTYTTLLEYAQKYTIEELKRSPILDNTKMKNHSYIELMHHWTKEETLKFWDKYYAEILRKVHIKTFASEKIKKLKEKGHKIYLVTARWDLENDNVKEITLKWLRNNDVQYDDFFMNAEEKLKIVKDKNIDVFVDDSFDNCKSIAYGSNAKVFLMDTRVNQNLEDEKITRVYSWPHLYQEIIKLKEEN